MIIKSLNPIALSLVILSVALSAKAALVPGTDPRFGPNSLTIDTSTQLAWLNLRESVGLSYEQALADTAPGGLFSGYRFATANEVLALYGSAGIQGTGYYPLATPSIQSLISLVGPTGTFQGEPEIAGITGSFNARGLLYTGQIYASGVNGSLEYLVTCGPSPYDLQVGPAFSAADLGNWLVMQVPEPSLWVFAIGGLLAFRCRSGFRWGRLEH